MTANYGRGSCQLVQELDEQRIGGHITFPATAVSRPNSHRERKCADTTGTVLVPWAGHFQCENIYIYIYIFQVKYTEAIYRTALGNCYGLKLAKC